jgi:DNA-binding MarR family transcriptional regulator
VLRAVENRPGATSSELAAVSGIKPSTLYTLLARLVKHGDLQTHTLPTGRSGYAIRDTSAAQTDQPAADDEGLTSDTD